MVGQPPAFMVGEFVDDYGGRFTITAGRWIQHPGATYWIDTWDLEGRYLIARNDDGNPSDGGRWTRIDWVELDGGGAYRWAFCMSAYDAPTRAAAAAARADHAHPETGCNEFPFSRMARQAPR